MSRLPEFEYKSDFHEEDMDLELANKPKPDLSGMIIHAYPKGVAIQLDFTDELDAILKDSMLKDKKLMSHLVCQIESKLLERNLVGHETFNFHQPAPDFIDVNFKLRFYPSVK